MINPRLLFVFFLLCFTHSLSAQNKNKRYLEYIDTYSPIAVEHMKKYKIPASITLAQGILESGAGQGTLAKKSNNHFGIKCGSDWRGKTVRHNDDALNECFRAYRNPKESYEDHAIFLTSRSRYASLFKLNITDYKAWARGLKKAGYATDPSYANRLIQLIEDYELYRYDSKVKVTKNKQTQASIVPHQPYMANGLVYVIARTDDTFESIGKEFGIKAGRLIQYNDLHKGYSLAEGDIIYLRKKKTKADKKYKVHVVDMDDSMHSISQKYGIRLKDLYRMNNKKPDDYIPEVGQRLRLR